MARLAFSIAINVPSDILLLDEVLSVGDAEFQQKCVAKFEEFKKKGKTIILVTHNLETVENYCDRKIVLENGRMVNENCSTENSC